jgi:hypothetical protein
MWRLDFYKTQSHREEAWRSCFRSRPRRAYFDNNPPPGAAGSGRWTRVEFTSLSKPIPYWLAHGFAVGNERITPRSVG